MRILPSAANFLKTNSRISIDGKGGPVIAWGMRISGRAFMPVPSVCRLIPCACIEYRANGTPQMAPGPPSAMTMKKKIVFGIWALAALAGGIYLLVMGQENPKEKILGEWIEKGSKLRIEVLPGEIRWRGMGHGKAHYEWLRYEKKPYRLRCTARGHTLEVDLHFSGDDTAIAEPDIWEHLSDEAKKMLHDINRQHGRPEQEFRLIFKRAKSHVSPS